RCMAVHSPFLAKRFCTAQHARFSVYVLVFLAFVLFSATSPILYTVDLNQQKCVIRGHLKKLIRYIKPAIFYFVPDILLLANLFVIYELWLATRLRKKTLTNPNNSISLNAANFNRKQRQLTIMLVTVSVSFYIFTTPAIIDYIAQVNPPQHHDVKKLKWRFLRINVTVLILQMNSVTNFIFYCLAGSKFRSACLDTLKEGYDQLLYLWYRHIMNKKNYEKPSRYNARLSGCRQLDTVDENRKRIFGDRQRRSTSIIANNNNSSKRPSRETILN
ncbi:unnamed protein product, partial [Didymodactylos carnosus]